MGRHSLIKFGALLHDLLLRFATETTCFQARFAVYSKSRCFSTSRCACIAVKQGSYCPGILGLVSRQANKVRETFFIRFLYYVIYYIILYNIKNIIYFILLKIIKYKINIKLNFFRYLHAIAYQSHINNFIHPCPRIPDQ